MKFRKQTSVDAFDGLTADEIRRIRRAAEANVTPGLEGLAPPQRTSDRISRALNDPLSREALAKLLTHDPIRSTDVLPVRKRGRRA